MDERQGSQTNKDLWLSAIANFKLKNFGRCVSDFEMPVKELEARLTKNPKNKVAARSLAFAYYLLSRCHMRTEFQDQKSALDFALKAFELKRHASESMRTRIIDNYAELKDLRETFNRLVKLNGQPLKLAETMFNGPWRVTHPKSKERASASFQGKRIVIRKPAP